MIRLPSNPRFTRPPRSVKHSPRLTNKNGVLTRSAPPSTARGTPHIPRTAASVAAMSGSHCTQARERAQPALKGFTRQEHYEQDALKHVHGRVRQAEGALEQAATRAD